MERFPRQSGGQQRKARMPPVTWWGACHHSELGRRQAGEAERAGGQIRHWDTLNLRFLRDITRGDTQEALG